jgi:hypothetical protein
MKKVIKNKLFNLILILVIILLGFFSIKSCQEKRTLLSQIDAVSTYKDTVKYYKSKSDQLIAYNNSVTVSLENLKHVNKELHEEIENLKLKKPKTVTKIQTEVEVKEIMIPYEVKIPCDTFHIPFTHTDKWFTITGFSSNTSLTINSLNLLNDMTIAVGEKKKGLFKPNEYVVAVKSNNPYFKTTSIENYTLKAKKPFYDKAWFKATLFFTGVVLGNRLK